MENFTANLNEYINKVLKFCEYTNQETFLIVKFTRVPPYLCSEFEKRKEKKIVTESAENVNMEAIFNYINVIFNKRLAYLT